MADIRVTKKENLIVWEEPIKKLGKDMVVAVDEGLIAVCCVNGTAVGEFYPGSSNTLNSGNQLVKAYGKKADIKLYAFNSQKPVEVKWGIGRMPASYNDHRCNDMELKVTAYGRCSILVIDASRLIGKMPPDALLSDGGITSDEIVEFVQRDIIAKVGPLLSRELAKIGDHTLIRAKMGEMAAAIKTGIGNMGNLGLRVVDFLVDNIDFTEESSAIIERYKLGQFEPLNTRIVAERAKQVTLMAEAAAAGQPATPEAPPATPTGTAASTPKFDVTFSINPGQKEDK